MSTYLVFVDDSGDESYRLYSALFVRAEVWRDVLARWLAWRRDLEVRFEIPVLYEIHSVKFFAGRGRPSIDASHVVNTSRALRRAIGEEALHLIADLGLRTLTVTRRGNAVRPAYAGLLRRVEQELSELESVGIVIVDGQDEDSVYWSAHRDLPLTTRRVIEDPWMQPSHGSQLVQMADIVAYSAHQFVVGDSSRRAMSDWYPRFIASSVKHPEAGEDGVVRF